MSDVDELRQEAADLLHAQIDGDYLVGAGRGLTNEGHDVAVHVARIGEVVWWAVDAMTPLLDRLANAEATVAIAAEAYRLHKVHRLATHTVHMSAGTRDRNRYAANLAMEALNDALTKPADAPQADAAAPVSASGAESGHGDRREGEGLA